LVPVSERIHISACAGSFFIFLFSFFFFHSGSTLDEVGRSKDADKKGSRGEDTHSRGRDVRIESALRVWHAQYVLGRLGCCTIQIRHRLAQKKMGDDDEPEVEVEEGRVHVPGDGDGDGDSSARKDFPLEEPALESSFF
jgi:hypothetical protein